MIDNDIAGKDSILEKNQLNFTYPKKIQEIASKGISNILDCSEPTITMTYDTNFDRNPDYSSIYIFSYMSIHCISGLYFGYQMSIFNNLGKPILREVF